MPGRVRLLTVAVLVAALALGCANPYRPVPDGIPSDRVIQPTVIILHWWGFAGTGGIRPLVDVLKGQTGYYEPNLTKAEVEFNAANMINGHHLGVQVGILKDGEAYQLTPRLDSYAAHSACGNGYAIGIEIEASGADDLRGNPAQFDSVVTITADLMRRYHIPLDGPLAADGLSGVGVHSHKEVDLNCKYADGSYAGAGKDDVDDEYLAFVKAVIRQRGLG
jgi:hypothetical protein